MKKFLSLFLCITFLIAIGSISATAEDDKQESPLIYGAESEANLELAAPSAILIEADTGTVLYCKNQTEKREPASVTKIMTLLLVCEAIDDGRIALQDSVTISDTAASMGGSQVFLEEGECFSVEELLKCTVIASANDAAVALAELISGNEANFVAEMNSRAKDLGMVNTKFENCTGLDDTTLEHLTTAEDIAIMSRELIKHDTVLKYSSLWQDSIRNGEFVLTNTNRLVRFYDGCNGLKTGSTDKAGFCVSATAKRGNMQLIAVIMGAESRDIRNSDARALLDYGFANFALYEKELSELESVRVKGGITDFVKVYRAPFSAVVKKSDLKKVEELYDIPESITAPVKKNDVVGSVSFYISGGEIGSCGVCVSTDVERIGFFGLLAKIIKNVLS